MTRPMQVPGCDLTGIYVPVYRTYLNENPDKKRLDGHIIIEFSKKKKIVGVTNRRFYNLLKMANIVGFFTNINSVCL